MKRGGWIVGVVLALSSPGLAQAQEAEAGAVYESALRYRRRDQPDRALGLLRQHYEATRELRALASMGLAELDLERFDDAERHLSEALSGSASPWVTAHRTELETELQRCRRRLGVGVLVLQSATEGAELFINGSRAGGAGRPVRMRAGAVNYEVRAPGFRPASRTVTVELGASVTEHVDLEREPPVVPSVTPTPAVTPAATPAPSVTPAAPVVTAPTREAPVAEPPPAPARGGGVRRTLAWVSVGGAAVFAGVGVLGQVVGQGAADRWNGLDCTPLDGRSREEVCVSDRDTAQAMGALRGIGFAGAGVLAVTSVVLFVTSSGGDAEGRRAFACGAGPGTFGVACGGRF